MFLTLKILFHLCFVIIFLLKEGFVFASAEDKKYNFTMLEKCQRFKPSWAQGVAFFSSTEFWQFQIQAEPRSDGRKGRYNGKYMFTGKKTEDIKPFEHLLLTCHCSDTLDPYFFFPTSLKVDGRNASNGIALCVREYRCKEPYECLENEKFYKQIPGINNTKDLYDLMAYEYSTLFHRNAMSANDFSDKFKFTCLDIYGKPTRSFDGVKSCLIQYIYNSSKRNDYVFKYSGPLIYGNLEYLSGDFLNRDDTAVQYKVEMSSAEQDSQYCYFHRNEKTFYSYTCICHGEKQHNCQIPQGKRICAFHISDEREFATEEMKHKWFKEQCEYFFISESEENVSISIQNSELLSYFSSNATCNHYEAKKWCSKNRENFYETYKACCNETDFCNKMWVIKLNDIKGDMMRSPFTCKYAAKGIAILHGTCELYLDLMTKNLVVLNEYVFQEMNNITSASKENCSYVIGTIQVKDNVNCSSQLYNSTGTVHSFYKCHCSTKDCDAENQDMAKEMNTAKFHDQFYCQTVNYSTNNSEYKPFANHVLKSVKNETGVLCFIEISKFNGTYSIHAKAIQDNSSVPTVCNEALFSPLSRSYIEPEKMRCCTAIAQHPQSSSFYCTIEIMLQKFKKQLKLQNEQKRLIGQEGNLQCGKKMCFISDGCFETRELTAVKKHKMIDEKTADSLECVDKIEEKVLSETKTISTHSTADYGYVCKLMESKDRCIVVHPPESNSKPLIVCCCNNNYKILSKDDETFQCPSKLEELPSQVGKKIGSFN